MINPCPADFWDNVAKRVAQHIIDRESSIGTNPSLATGLTAAKHIAAGGAHQTVEWQQKTKPQAAE